MLVINPACDIAHSPGHRKFQEELSLLLVPGSLELIPGEVESLKGTELIRLAGKHYRIGWDIERLISVRFGEIGNWVSEHGYELVAQMRLPYVLQVQQRFVANLTRVGTPVPAPIYQRADAQILVRDEGEFASNLYAVLLQAHKKRQLVLPWVTLLAAREGLRKVCEAAARRSPSPKGLPKWKEACQHPEWWWRHEVPQDLPKPNRLKKLGDMPVAFSFNSIFDVQKELKQYPVIIKIVADEPEGDDEVPS